MFDANQCIESKVRAQLGKNVAFLLSFCYENRYKKNAVMFTLYLQQELVKELLLAPVCCGPVDVELLFCTGRVPILRPAQDGILKATPNVVLTHFKGKKNKRTKTTKRIKLF